MNVIIISGIVNITDLKHFLICLSDIGKKHIIIIQALNADLLSGSRHIIFAVNKALRSFASGKNIANNPNMEIMLYASGTRQIERALAMGVKAGKNRIAVVLSGENEMDEAEVEVRGLIDTIDPAVLDYSESKRDVITKFFNITPEELDAVGDKKIPELVLERVALMEVIK
jgi:KEOPS complex subunit Cgi121